MPIPSFDELLSQARTIGEGRSRAQDFNRGELIARSTSKFVNDLMFTEGKDRATYAGEVNPSGEITSYDKPRVRGRTLFERMSGVPGMEDMKASAPAADGTVRQPGVPVSREELSKAIFARGLEQEKQKGRVAVVDKANAYRRQLAAIQAGKESLREKIAASKAIISSIEKDIEMGFLSGQDVSPLESMRDEEREKLRKISGDAPSSGGLKDGDLKAKATTWLTERGQATTPANIDAVIKAGKVR